MPGQAGKGRSTTVPASPRVPVPPGTECIEHIWIPARDGVRLSARIWLPEDANDRPVPALLEATPYRKGDITAPGDASRHGYFAQRGYASVRLDIRGSGDSEGILPDEYLAQEQQDALDVISWIARQPWCTKRVGMFGYSWGGFAALQAAALRPPELAAIITVSSSDDRFAEDVHYMGGCVLAHYMLSWAATMGIYATLPPDPAVVGDAWRERWHERLRGARPLIEHWLSHQRRDSYWQHGSVCEDYSAIRCPVYAIGGWADGYRNTVLRLLEHLDAPCKGLIGPWSHHYPDEATPPGPAIGFLQECLRWWDYWLKGIDTGIMDEPPLRVWMQDAVRPRTSYEVRPGRWLAEPAWPSPDLTPRHLFLTPTGLLDAPAGEARVTVATPQMTGLLAGDWDPFGNPADLPPDQRAEDGCSVTFTSEVLTEPVAILGQPRLVLELASDKPVALLAVRLCDVWEDGASALITRGLLNLTHREGSEHPVPLRPGSRETVTIPLKAIAQVLPAGHRLRVSVSSTYWPWAWPSPAAAVITLFTGRGCRLELPVRTGWEHASRPAEFGPPEQAIRPETVTLAFRPGDYELAASLGQNRYQLVHRYPEFHVRWPHTGVELTWVEPDTFTITGDDPLSARVDCHRSATLARDDWSVRLEASSAMAADAEQFFVTTALHAYERQTCVFANAWSFRVPRDHA
jgi:putative CocE/NonD family hydrolase